MESSSSSESSESTHSRQDNPFWFSSQDQPLGESNPGPFGHPEMVEGSQDSFSMDAEDFGFKTRLRPLSSIEAASTSREQSARVPENTRPHSARSDWEARVKTLLKNSGKSIEELHTIIQELDQRADIPSGSPLVDRLLTAHAEALVFEKQAGEWLSYGPDGNRARLHDIMEFLSRASSYKIDNVQLLQKYADMATSLEYISEDVLSNRFPAGNDIFEEIVQWKAYVREQGLTRAIILPIFDKLVMQMELHKAWLKDIPQYFAEHPEIIFEDVLRCTQPQDDLPLADNDFYTCICTSPVMPPPTGMISDAVQCDHCLARFHGECAKNVKSCLFCDQNHWNGTIHKQHEHDTFHFCSLQTILANAPEISKNYSELYQQLEIIVRRTDRLSSIIGRFLSHTSCPERQRAEHLHLGRHYMRKLYKIPFTVSQNLGTSFGLDLAVLHATLARRPQPLAIRPIQKQPCLTFRQDTDEDWMDGTRCICRGQSAGLRGYPTVECEYCGRLYHTGCVFHPISTRHMKFVCPLCCLRKGEEYKNSDVRVIPSVTNGIHPNIYVDVKRMLDTFSQNIQHQYLAIPHRRTLYVELVQFQPRSPPTSSSPLPASPWGTISAPPMSQTGDENSGSSGMPASS